MHPDNPFFIVTTLSGVSLLIGAWLIRCRPPKEINALYGYRTKRSKASQENWDLAQDYSIRRMFEGGAALTVIGLIDLFLPAMPEWLAVILSLSLVVGAAYYIFYTTEKALSQM